MYRIEVIGPYPLGGGLEYWAILVFDDQGRKIGQLDASSEKEALYLKDKIAAALTGNP